MNDELRIRIGVSRLAPDCCEISERLFWDGAGDRSNESPVAGSVAVILATTIRVFVVEQLVVQVRFGTGESCANARILLSSKWTVLIIVGHFGNRAIRLGLREERIAPHDVLVIGDITNVRIGDNRIVCLSVENVGVDSGGRDDLQLSTGGIVTDGGDRIHSIFGLNHSASIC